MIWLSGKQYSSTCIAWYKYAVLRCSLAESFTPDRAPLLGESPDLRGFFIGSGFNSAGMMYGGGAGREIANWVVKGKPDIDLFAWDVR